MTNQSRAPWTKPVLKQLTVDLDAIANKRGPGSDKAKSTKNNKS